MGKQAARVSFSREAPKQNALWAQRSVKALGLGCEAFKALQAHVRSKPAIGIATQTAVALARDRQMDVAPKALAS